MQNERARSVEFKTEAQTPLNPESSWGLRYQIVKIEFKDKMTPIQSLSALYKKVINKKGKTVIRAIAAFKTEIPLIPETGQDFKCQIIKIDFKEKVTPMQSLMALSKKAKNKKGNTVTYAIAAFVRSCE